MNDNPQKPAALPKSKDRSEPIYLLEKVEKVREKGGVVFQLSVPEFKVRAGEIVAVVGPSGCGKSTLLDMLGLVLSASSADRFSLSFKDGSPLELKNLPEAQLALIRRRHIGYVLQTGGLLPFLSVGANIALPARLNGQPGVEKRVAAIATRLGIGDQLTKKPAHLSGGQRQRTAIARALVHQPAIVLADEPTAAVDELTALEIRDTFKELAEELNVALVLVTHDRSLAKGTAHRTMSFEISKPDGRTTASKVVEVQL